MASAASLSEEQFKCSICLEVFTEPVSTPCGHNYCKDCITGYWSATNHSLCPLCQEIFHQTPELRVNMEFRDMLEIFKRSARTANENSAPLVQPGEVPCDVCDGTKRKALKSCLVCLASYCDTHLQPHCNAQALKWHKLINAAEKLEDRVCNKHQKMKEFFCSKDQSCVCVVCLKDDHVMHEVTSLEDECKERRKKIKLMTREVHLSLNQTCIMSQRIQNSMTQGQQEVERAKAEINQSLAALVASIMAKKVEMIKLLEEKQRASERQTGALVRRLQLEIVEKHQLIKKLEDLSKTDDDFRLLQDLPVIPTRPNSDNQFTAATKILLKAKSVKSMLAEVEMMVKNQMENIIRDVDKDMMAEGPAYTKTQTVFDDELGKIQREYATNVTFDLETAHPSLIISDDFKQVRDGVVKREVPDNPTRFDTLHYVLANKGFSSGKFYYEVALKEQSGWEVGVAQESISRKGDRLSLSPENGCWTLGVYWRQCQANTNPPVGLSLAKKPKKIGVFVDYEGGLVSFYNVDTRALIYSFTKCVFTANAKILSSFLPFSTKTRIYPIFRPSSEKRNNSAPLQITPVS